MLPKKSLSTLFGFLNTPVLSEIKVFNCPDRNEYSIIAEWTQTDTFRKDSVSYLRNYLVTLPQHDMHESLHVDYTSQLQFTSFGQCFPFASQNHVRTIWDIKSPEGCHRAVCIECNPPLASNPSKSTVASTAESGIFIQVWINGRFTNSIKLPTLNARHGRVYPSNSSTFHGARWSNARDKIVYLAEVCNNPSENTTTNDQSFKDDPSSFVFQEDWGEGNEGSHKPKLCILDLTTETVSFAPIDENNYNLACSEPLWSPDDNGIIFVGYPSQAYNLGLIYCIQRPSQLYFWDIKKNSIEPISVPGYSVQCPRFNPNGTYLIWLQNPVGGPHGQCVSLVGTQWPMNCLKPEVIIPIINSPCSDYKCTIDRFPGLYCKLADRCWSSDGQHVLVSSCWGFEVVGLLISVTESIAQSRPVIYKLPKLYLSSDGTTLSSSLSILDVYDDVLVVSVSSPIHPQHIAVLNLKYLNYANLSSDLNQRPWLIISDGIDLKQNHLRSLKGIDWSVHQIELENKSDNQINSFECLLVHPILQDDGSIQQIDVSDFTFAKDLTEIVACSLRGLIVMPHGGPHAHSSASWSSIIAGFCSVGFACLLINYRGSLGYGNAFVQDLIGYISEKDVSDCVQATKFALNYLQKFGSNLKAVLFGGSHGGFLTLHLASRYKNLYHVATARNPVAHLVSLIDTSDIPDWCYTESGLADWCEWPLGHLPNGNELMRLSNQSPLKYLDKTWSVPLLMLLGGKDRRVPNSQGLTFCRKLKALCPTVPCETLLYPYDSHPLDSPACSLDVFVNCVNWFLKHL
ncbi:unnamed protein product [Schistosoma mattheei]|uniref:Acylamino-acid-releasing enzyme n=1 Tax=Schistosoma mattheei TaxID=31246 RepID=A0AA85BTK4_9TREM|nr:unnamed protein product [Schistosoma mattheei]